MMCFPASAFVTSKSVALGAGDPVVPPQAFSASSDSLDFLKQFQIVRPTVARRLSGCRLSITECGLLDNHALAAEPVLSQFFIPNCRFLSSGHLRETRLPTRRSHGWARAARRRASAAGCSAGAFARSGSVPEPARRAGASRQVRNSRGTLTERRPSHPPRERPPATAARGLDAAWGSPAIAETTKVRLKPNTTESHAARKSVVCTARMPVVLAVIVGSVQG